MFSIVIPLYNKEKYIYDTLLSVFNQTYTDFEVIVVNDSSTDNSLTIVNEFNDERLRVFTKPNGGVSAARNFGIKQAKHDYIAFLDADDLWKPNHLECIVDALSHNPECGMTHSGYIIFKDEVENIIGVRDAKMLSQSKIIIVKDYFKACYYYKTILGLTSAVCIKKSLLDTFDEPFKVGVHCGEDADLWLKVACKTNVIYINEHTMLYRYASENSLFISNFYDKKCNIDYTKWYDLKSNSRYKELFLNLFVGRYAFGLAKAKQKKSAREILSLMHGKMDFKTVVRYIVSKLLVAL